MKPRYLFFQLVLAFGLILAATYAQERPIITPDNVSQLEIIATFTDIDYNAITGLAWSEDSQYLAVGRFQRVFVYSTSTFSDLVETPNVGSSSVAFSPVEPLLAIAVASGMRDVYEPGIYLQDLSTGEVHHLTHRGVWKLAFSPDGRLLASGSGDGQVYLWDIETLQRVSEVRTTRDTGPLRLVFSPDGNTLVVHNSGNIQFWDVNSLLTNNRGLATSELTPVNVLSLPVTIRGGTSNIVFDDSGDNLFFATSERDETMWLQQWTVGNIGRSNGEMRQLSEATQRFRNYDTITNIAIHPTEDMLALASSDGRIYIVDAQTQEQLAVLQDGRIPAPIQHIAFSPDGTMLAVSSRTGAVIVLSIP